MESIHGRLGKRNSEKERLSAASWFGVRFGLLIGTLGLAVAQSPTPKPDFTGHWLLQEALQSGSGPRIANDYRFLVIEHHEPRLKVTLTGVENDPSRRETSAHTTDGQVNTNNLGGKEIKSKTFWDGTRLVTEWLSVDRGVSVHHRQVWSLSPDGKRLTIQMRDGELGATVIALKQ